MKRRNGISPQSRSGGAGDLDGWDYSIKGWCVTLLYPEREAFYGTHLAIALGWCLVWMMGTTGELGVEGLAS